MWVEAHYDIVVGASWAGEATGAITYKDNPATIICTDLCFFIEREIISKKSTKPLDAIK